MLKTIKWPKLQKSTIAKVQNSIFVFFREKSFPIKFLEISCPYILYISIRISKCKERTRRVLLFLCAMAFSFIFMCKWIFKQKHFLPFGNSEGSRCFRIWRFLRPWPLAYFPHSLLNKTTSIRRGPSFSWCDGFSPSPVDIRVCAHRLIVKS